LQIEGIVSFLHLQCLEGVWNKRKWYMGGGVRVEVLLAAVAVMVNGGVISRAT